MPCAGEEVYSEAGRAGDALTGAAVYTGDAGAGAFLLRGLTARALSGGWDMPAVLCRMFQ